MKRRIIIAANWKMEPPTSALALKLWRATASVAAPLRGVSVVACPPAVYISDIRRAYRGRTLALGAQDVSADASGAHTGETSALMLRNLGVIYAIVGHSERRARGEESALVSKKVSAALAEGLSVILCIGERERDEHGEYLHFLRTEFAESCATVTPEQVGRLLIAYEPLWAIGKHAADAISPAIMHETGIYLRKLIAERYGLEAAHRTPVLYGGSVEPENASALLTRGAVDGFLVGHASLDPKAFQAILSSAHAYAKARP